MFEVSLADLQNNEVAFRKVRGTTEYIQGKNCLISVAWILTLDNLCSAMNKCQVVIEAHVDVRSAVGYLFCLFCIGFMKKCNNMTNRCAKSRMIEITIRGKQMEKVL